MDSNPARNTIVRPRPEIPTRRVPSPLPSLLVLLASGLPSLPALRAAGSGRQVLPLDGTWEIVFDRENEGRDGGWHRPGVFPGDRARKIPVPSCWELTEKDYEGVAFYRRSFRVPPGWSTKVVRLRFDAVNFLAEVWLNGHAVGCDEGGFTPFELRIVEQLGRDPVADRILYNLIEWASSPTVR